MSFFQKLAALQLASSITMVITPAGDKLTVSVVPDNPKGGENRTRLSPISVTATPAELDAELVQAIGQPLQQGAGMIVQMADFNKSVNAASKASTSGSSKPATPASKPAPALPAAPPVDKKAEAYQKAMKEVESLRDSKKYQDAIKKLPDVKEYPDKKSIIDARRKWLVEQAMGGSLIPEPWPVDPTDKPVEPTPAPQPTPSAEDDESEHDDEYDEREEEQLDSPLVDQD